MDQQLNAKIEAYIHQNRSAIVEDLKTLVRIRSVSENGSGDKPFGEGCAKVLNRAVEMARANAERNGLSGVMDCVAANVFDLLPALPAAWPQGKVRGLHARGGYTVDMVWENGKLAEVVIRACENSPETVTVRYRGTEQKVSFSSSERQSGTEKHLKF